MDKATIDQKLQNPDSGESLLIEFITNPPSENYFEQEEQLFASLGREGWNRKRIYDVCMYIQHNRDLTEIQHDNIGEFLNGLNGYCSPDNHFSKLPSEPENSEALISYVRSDWWKD